MKLVSIALTVCLSLSAMSIQATEMPPSAADDYGFAYWLNGFRKHAKDRSPEILCFETGRFGMVINLNNLPDVRLGAITRSASYQHALAERKHLMRVLPEATLAFEITHAGTTYRATRCAIGKPSQRQHLSNIRMWEAGQIVQHYELQGIIFESADGTALPCDARLYILVWPGSITLRAEVSPILSKRSPIAAGKSQMNTWIDASMRISLKSAEHSWDKMLPVHGEWRTGIVRSMTVNCDMAQAPSKDASIQVATADGQSIQATFDPDFYCYKAEIKKIKRTWKSGYTDIRNYDEFKITIDQPTDNPVRVPFLLYLRKPANITGLCPILCDTDGVPTGIPVQLSKNWHDTELGPYLRAYTLLPAKPGRTNYILRVAYGFYGSLPSASHAQLSLVGYGGHGRWDQLAIGCWGETMCFDMDMSCVDVAITDARMLMARNGQQGRQWSWTDAGWGGDWLNLKDQDGNKLLFAELKTAYLSHGPCLTEVQYDGFYGSERQVDLRSTIRTLRTDDYARTFQTLRYEFNQPVATEDGWLFKMGRTNGYITPKVAYGNRLGLTREHQVPQNLVPGSTHIAPFPMDGQAPYWVAFPGASHVPQWHNGFGSRSLVIRAYHASINGTEYTNPTISFPVFQVHQDGLPNLDMLIAPPTGVDQFLPGDSIELEVEWITLHRQAEDYYGPNQSYLTHLKKYPRSWRTTHREAQGNDLTVETQGGTLLHNYPIIVQANAPEVRLRISGGIGAVPVRFEGLSSLGFRLYRIVDGLQQELDQAVHGNDYWQTDYDTATRSYRLSFNIELDEIDTSEWVLRLETVGEQQLAPDL
jgi:hypothetical protein